MFQISSRKCIGSLPGLNVAVCLWRADICEAAYWFACEHLSGIKKCFSFASLVYLLNFCIRRSSCFRMPSRVLSQVVIAGSWSRLADCIIVKAAIKLS